MSTLQYRFINGVGLQVSAAPKTQSGALVFENVDLGVGDVVQKRPGGNLIARSTTDSPNDEIPVSELTALWYRDDELCLEASDELYSRRDCAGDGEVSQGTATAGEIADARATIDARTAADQDVIVPLTSPAPPTADAMNRLKRKADAFTPMVFDGVTTATLVFAAGTLRLDWTGADTGTFAFPALSSSPTFIFRSGSVTDATITVAVSYTVNTCTLYVYDVIWDGADLNVTLRYTVANVLGSYINPAADADHIAVGYVQSSIFGPLFVSRTHTGTTVSHTIVPADQTTISASNNFLLDCDLTWANIDGTRWVIVPLDDPTQMMFYEFPLAGSLGNVARRNTRQSFGATDEVGISWGGGATDSVIAISLAGTPTASYSYLMSSPDEVFNSILVGDFVARYSVDGSNNLYFTPVFNDVEITPVLLATGVEDVTAAGLADGRHLMSMRKVAGVSGEIWGYSSPGNTQPLVEHVYADVAAHFVGVGPTYLVGGVLTGDGPTSLSLRATNDFLSWDVDQSVIADARSSIDGTSLYFHVTETPDVIVRFAVYNNDDESKAYRYLYTATYDMTNDALSGARDDALSFVGPDGAVIGFIESGTPPRIICAVRDIETSTIEVYEINTNLFVRVQPATVSLPGGDWTSRGPWTRTRCSVSLSADWGSRTVVQLSSATVLSNQTGRECVLSLIETTTGLEAVVYSTHAESGGPISPVLVDVNGTRPRVANCSEGQLAMTYKLIDDSILYQFWGSGQSFGFNLAGFTLRAPEKLYDMDAGILADGRGYMAMVYLDVGGELRVQFRYDDGVVVTYSDGVPAAIPGAVSIYAVPVADSVPRVLIGYSMTVAGGVDWVVKALSLDAAVPPTVGVVDWSATGTTGIAGDIDHQISVGATDEDYATTGQLAVELQRGTERRVEFLDTGGGTPFSLGHLRRAAVYGSCAVVSGCVVTPITSVETSQVRELRSGILFYCATTGEYISRIGFGEAETLTLRSTFRLDASRFNRVGDSYTLGYATTYGEPNPNPNITKFIRIDATARPNNPAVLQGAAVSAHAGYPRAYDGVTVFEHDWHELPTIEAVSPSGGAGALPNGNYGVAVTYEAVDGQELLYRSAPTFDAIEITAGPKNIIVDVRPLSRSERPLVQLVVWRTLLNGTAYYRALVVDALQDLDTLSLTLSATDAQIADNAILDQGPSGTLSSQPTRVTDWIAGADGRLWSRDYERDYLSRFTIPISEGYAPHWNLAQGIETSTSRKVSGVAEMDGRMIMVTPIELHTFGAGGPSATGIGAYGQPNVIPSEAGAEVYNTIQLTPMGLVYGGPDGPLILTRGLSVYDFGDIISRPYQVDGESVQTIAYVPNSAIISVSNGPQGRTFRYHGGNQRWGEDIGRPLLDQAVSNEGRAALLVGDGRIIVESSEPNRSAPRSDGGTPYRIAVGTPWIHEPSRGTAHSGYDITGVTVYGERVASHDLFIDVYYDYDSTPRATYTVPAAVIDQRDADGLPYIYTARWDGVHCFACRIVVRDNTEESLTFRLESLEIHWSADGSAREFQWDDGAYLEEV